MGNLKFGDVSTKDLDLIIQAPPLYEFPERDVRVEHIPGRNGDLIVDNDCYKNVTRTYSIASIIRPGADFISNSAKLIGWLTSKAGYQRLEDSYDPEVFRLATFNSGGSLQNYYDAATAINITFDCKPQRYLKIGEKLHEYTFNLVPDLENIEINIESPTLTKALPEIKISNLETDREYVLMFNTINYKNEVVSSITLSKVPYDNVTIDSENQVAYTNQNGTIKNLNKYINLNGKGFPKLDMKQSTLKLEKYVEKPSEIMPYSDLISNTMKTLFAKHLSFESVLESKQEKYTIMSFDKLKISKQEEYAAESYQNLALDKSQYFSFKSFNDVLLNNCGMVSFATFSFNNRDWNDMRYVTPSGFSDPVVLNGLIMLIANPSQNWYAAFVIKGEDADHKNGFENGAFIQLDDKTDSKCNSIKIIRVNAHKLSEINNEQFYDTLVSTGGKHEDNIFYQLQLSDNAKSSLFHAGDKSDDIIISLYPSTANNKLDLEYTHPDFMDIEVVYDSERSNSHPLVEKVYYKPTKPGYYYKKSNDGNGLLSGLVGSLISKLFNKTGWSKITTSGLSRTVLEEIKWDTNKRAFVSGSLLSSNSDYTVSRNFIDIDHLPQYEDIVLKDTYVLDDKGNPKLDAAGNKINKVIEHRIEVTMVSDDLKQIVSAKVLYDGYYSFNDDEDYSYYEANATITSPSFNTDTTKSNLIKYLQDVPTYESVEDFPEWIDPIPVFYDSSDQPYDPTSRNRINAAYCDFRVNKTGWYWYNFMENDIVKRTEFTKRNAGDLIGNFNLDPSTPHFRNTEEDFALFYMDYKSNSSVFPIHEYEYVDSLDKENVYILNDKTLVAYSSSSTYAVGDYCYYDDETTGIKVYKCRQAIETPKAWDSDDWDLIGIYVTASEYNSETSYELGSYCIHEMKLHKCRIATIAPKQWTSTDWEECGSYIKNIGFYYLTDGGKEEEIYLNILPEWIDLHLVLGDSEDYSDTTLEFKANEGGLYKWDTNTEWINKNKSDVIITGSYNTDTYVYFLDELPEYDPAEYDDIYDLSEIDQNENGNPEKVIIRANVDGYFKIGASTNYEYHSENDILFELSINNQLSLVYLEPQEIDQSMKNIKIDIKPRWWSL